MLPTVFAANEDKLSMTKLESTEIAICLNNTFEKKNCHLIPYSASNLEENKICLTNLHVPSSVTLKLQLLYDPNFMNYNINLQCFIAQMVFFTQLHLMCN